MSRSISTYVEKFLWNNLKMYLMLYETCLLDELLVVENQMSNVPLERYKNFMVELNNHIGLGSYVTQQATQFSNLPYITARINPYDIGHCTSKAIVSFDVVFATDTPHNTDADKNPGNSSESVAAFRAAIINGLDKLMYEAYTPADGIGSQGAYQSPAFFDALRDQTLPNPVKPEVTKPWIYNVNGTVDDDKEITEVIQLKREDRASGLSVFTVSYVINIDGVYGGDVDCGC